MAVFITKAFDIPLLKDFNPKIVERLAEAARLLQSELPPPEEANIENLKLSELKLLPEGDLKRKIRSWISANRGNLRRIELKHTEAIERLINSRKSGKTIELPGGDKVYKEGGELVLGKNMVEKRRLGN